MEMTRIHAVRQTPIMPEDQQWFNNCHASTLVKVGENDFLCAFMAGEKEAAPDFSIWLARCENGRWLDPLRIKSIYRLPHWNPVLHLAGDRLWLYYKVGPSVPLWYTRKSYSDDLGRTWSESVEAVEGDHSTRIAVRAKLLVTADGSWLGPCSEEGEKDWDCYVDVSRDQGATWHKRPIPLTHRHDEQNCDGAALWSGLAEGALWESNPAVAGKWDGVIQPTLWESEPGIIHAFMRSTRGSVYRSDSLDNGDSWCEAYPTNLPNNNSGLDAVKMRDGTLALAYNPVAGNWSARTPLSLAFSEDNGITFPEQINLETRNGEYSYPALIADKETLHFTYTSNRKNIIFGSCTPSR